MKYLLLIIITITYFNSHSQELITEFITTHSNVGTGVVKNNIQFQLFDNKLVLNYLDKKTIKMMSKNGMDPSLVFSYTLSKESNDLSMWYQYEDDQLQIILILEGIPNPPSVTIKSRDSFTGQTTSSQLYFSM